MLLINNVWHEDYVIKLTYYPLHRLLVI